MKATELMIGDCVLTLDATHKEKVFAQVDAIEEGKRSILVKRECSNWFVDIDWIEPIPLTTEILERNGFEYKDAWAEWWHRSEDGFGSDFQLSITESGFSMKDIGNAKINFVHQLQHALRLCGLNELADNLKLEK